MYARNHNFFKLLLERDFFKSHQAITAPTEEYAAALLATALERVSGNQEILQVGMAPGNIKLPWQSVEEGAKRLKEFGMLNGLLN